MATKEVSIWERCGMWAMVAGALPGAILWMANVQAEQAVLMSQAAISNDAVAVLAEESRIAGLQRARLQTQAISAQASLDRIERNLEKLIFRGQ